MHSSPVLRLATHTDMHAIWQIDADVFGEDVYPGFFFRQAMDLWPELLVVAEREGRLLGYALGGVQFIHDHLEAALLLIVAVSVLPMVVEWWRHRRAAASSASKLAQADSAKIE